MKQAMTCEREIWSQGSKRLRRGGKAALELTIMLILFADSFYDVLYGRAIQNKLATQCWDQ